MREREKERQREDNKSLVAALLEAHRAHLTSQGGLERKAVRRRERVFHDVLRERAAARVLADAGKAGERVLAALQRGELDPYAAADALLGEAPDQR